LVWQKIALTNIWGLKGALSAKLLFVFDKFIIHFIEVHSKRAAQFLHDPIQCAYGNAIILYLHELHQKRV
jgi:hypothetical protein